MASFVLDLVSFSSHCNCLSALSCVLPAAAPTLSRQEPTVVDPCGTPMVVVYSCSSPRHGQRPQRDEKQLSPPKTPLLRISTSLCLLAVGFRRSFLQPSRLLSGSSALGCPWFLSKVRLFLQHSATLLSSCARPSLASLLESAVVLTYTTSSPVVNAVGPSPFTSARPVHDTC